MNMFVASLGFGLVTASILALAAVGFTLQFGVTNILNLAYGDVMTASAFVGLHRHQPALSIWLALVAWRGCSARCSRCCSTASSTRRSSGTAPGCSG